MSQKNIVENIKPSKGKNIFPFLGIGKDIHNILTIKEKYRSVEEIENDMFLLCDELDKLQFGIFIYDMQVPDNHPKKRQRLRVRKNQKNKIEVSLFGRLYGSGMASSQHTFTIQDAIGAILSVQENHLSTQGYCTIQVEDYSETGDRILPTNYIDKARRLLLELQQSRSGMPQIIFNTLSKLSGSYEKGLYYENEQYIYDQYMIVDSILRDVQQTRREQGYTLADYDAIVQKYNIDKLSDVMQERLRCMIFGLRYSRNQLDVYENHKDPEAFAARLHDLSPDRLHNPIRIEVKDIYVHILPSSRTDFETLYARDNKENMIKAPRVAGYQIFDKGVPIIVQRTHEQAYPGFDISTHKHERRHVRDWFFIESSDAIVRAKKEILAYMRTGTKLSYILSLLTDSNGLYTYDLVDDARASHKKEITKRIHQIGECSMVNLDALALFYNNRQAVLSQPQRFTRGKIISEIVPVIQ